MSLRLGKWKRWTGSHAFRCQMFRPRFAGTSGGRTSAMMAALSAPDVLLCFQNTGLEHPRTLDFLAELGDALGREIRWLEYRPPARIGAPPRESRVEIVTHKTASRRGEPFRMMLDAVAAYRRDAKGLGPIAPWARGRICTAYLKWKTLDRYLESLGVGVHDRMVGLRHDEQHRISRMRDRESKEGGDADNRFPLDEARIAKADVLAFWAEQDFDLDLEEYQGNCTGCFLKDEADIARALAEPGSNADWWFEAERSFPDFGGRKFPGYAQLAIESRWRIAIEHALRNDLPIPAPPIEDSLHTGNRARLVVLQEKRRLAGTWTAIGCNCEPPGAEAVE